MHYLVTDITEELAGTIIPDQKIKLLQNLDSTLGDILIRSDLSLDPGNPPINIMFQRWLKSQLEELQS